MVIQSYQNWHHMAILYRFRDIMIYLVEIYGFAVFTHRGLVWSPGLGCYPGCRVWKLVSKK